MTLTFNALAGPSYLKPSLPCEQIQSTLEPNTLDCQAETPFAIAKNVSTSLSINEIEANVDDLIRTSPPLHSERQKALIQRNREMRNQLHQEE